MTILPIVMIRNEEYWIEAVLTPLVNVFPVVIVGDTASTDKTPEIVKQFEKIHFVQLGNADPAQVGLFRERLQHIARERGATHVIMVDGDELYTTSAMRHIVETTPVDVLGGFPTGAGVMENNGELWFCGKCCRHAVFSVDSKWQGLYPFESPDTYQPGHAKNFYYTGGFDFHYIHLHHLRRSSRDAEVHMRNQKRMQCSMLDIPLVPEGLWLRVPGDYQDS